MDFFSEHCSIFSEPAQPILILLAIESNQNPLIQSNYLQSQLAPIDCTTNATFVRSKKMLHQLR